MKNPVSYIILIFGFILSASCSIINPPVKPDITFSDTIFTNISGKGLNLIINFEKGSAHNHPTFVFWAEDMNENYIQTLFVTKSFATGIFGYGPLNDSLWGTEPGMAKRPAALPYWWHKCNPIQADVPSPDKPFVDAYTGATPAGSFILKTKTDKIIDGKFRILMEINQPWDWNDYWTTTKFPDNAAYKTSCQPSLVYAVTIDFNRITKEYYLNPVGHGHYSGKNGLLYTDISTITTAKEIVKRASIKLY